MRPRTLEEIAGAVGGRVEGPEATVTRVVTDSRGDLAGALFVALPGEHHDGHSFIEASFEAGAAGAMISRGDGWGGPVVRVANVGEALMALAAAERTSFEGPVVGITGSTGKTTTKDLSRAVLASRFRVHASPRSFNTEVGVPLTILNAPDRTEALVLEMGSRGLGHIEMLCRSARPTVGVLTNVGAAHLEMFGSRETVARAKAELVEALPENGVAILNADDPVVSRFGERTTARIISYGLGDGAEVRAGDVTLDPDARAAFTLSWRGEDARVELAVTGEHMIPNALAAAAAGLALGGSVAECAAALKGAAVSRWRMEVRDRADGVRIVNDAYNANPTSMAAALKAARWMARDRRCVAVLGEMAELGDAAVEEHDRVGEQVARLGIEELVTIGELGRVVARAATREGVEPGHVRECASAGEALAALRDLVRPGDVVLIKASRAVGLDRLASSLLSGEEGTA